MDEPALMASHNVTLTCFISKFLSTDELDVFAKNDVVLQRYYAGCYPADVMPVTIKKRCCWIWNVDEKDKPGTHWIAIVKEDRDIFFLTVLERHLNFSNVNIGWIIFTSGVDV